MNRNWFSAVGKGGSTGLNTEPLQALSARRRKESMLRARLYQIQAAMATTLKQMSLSQVGRVRADRDRLSASPLLGVCN